MKKLIITAVLLAIAPVTAARAANQADLLNALRWGEAQCRATIELGDARANIAVRRASGGDYGFPEVNSGRQAAAETLLLLALARGDADADAAYVSYYDALDMGCGPLVPMGLGQ